MKENTKKETEKRKNAENSDKVNEKSKGEIKKRRKKRKSAENGNKTNKKGRKT